MLVSTAITVSCQSQAVAVACCPDLGPVGFRELALHASPGDAGIAQPEVLRAVVPSDDRAKPLLEYRLQCRALGSRNVARFTQEFIRQLDGRLHMGNHTPLAILP